MKIAVVKQGGNLIGGSRRSPLPRGRKDASARRPYLAAFTMIEIAIAVGVIGFAMVAIIGILPTGMNSQKDNREDTIIAQDAPYFINAIRNGEMRTNNNVLTNFVEEIVITNVTPNPAPGATNILSYYNQTLNNNATNDYLTNDMAIIGLLSTPECDTRNITTGPYAATVGAGVVNEVSAVVRAMSGSPMQQQGANSLTAFRYLMTVEIVPWNYFTQNPLPPFLTPPVPTMVYPSPGYTPQYLAPPNMTVANYNQQRMNYLMSSVHEMRVKFAWPVHLLPNGNIQSIGNGRQTYRTLICSHLTNYDGLHWYFQPGTYTTNFNQ